MLCSNETQSWNIWNISKPPAANVFRDYRKDIMSWNGLGKYCKHWSPYGLRQRAWKNHNFEAFIKDSQLWSILEILQLTSTVFKRNIIRQILSNLETKKLFPLKISKNIWYNFFWGYKKGTQSSNRLT